MVRWPTFAVLMVMLAAQALLCPRGSAGYLELHQTDAKTYAVLWKVPAVGDMRLSIHPRFPENCKTVGDVASYRASDSYTERLNLAAHTA